MCANGNYCLFLYIIIIIVVVDSVVDLTDRSLPSATHRHASCEKISIYVPIASNDGSMHWPIDECSILPLERRSYQFHRIFANV